MLKNIAAIVILAGLNKFVYRLDASALYDILVTLMADHGMTITAYATLAAVGLLVITYLFENMGLFKVAYIVSKITVQICQMLLLLVALLNVFFYYTLETHFILGSGLLIAFVLLELLTAASLAISIVDFNNHCRNAIVPSVGIIFGSILFVQFLAPMFNR